MQEKTYSFLLLLLFLVTNSFVKDRKINCNRCSNNITKLSSSSINFCSSTAFPSSITSFPILLLTVFTFSTLCFGEPFLSHNISIIGLHCRINWRPFWYAFNLPLNVVAPEIQF